MIMEPWVDDILKVLAAAVGVVLTAAGAYAVAWLQAQTRKLAAETAVRAAEQTLSLLPGAEKLEAVKAALPRVPVAVIEAAVHVVKAEDWPALSAPTTGKEMLN